MKSGQRQRRILKEIQTIEKQYSQEIEILKIHQLQYGIFIINGPLQSPYEGFCFRVKVTWPQKYPFVGVGVQFLDPIWSPYVNKKNGQICVDILKQCWTITLTTFTVLLSIKSLLSQNKIFGEQFLNPLAASQMKTNYYYFFDYAKNEAQKNSYAKKQIYHDSMRSKEEEVKILEKQDKNIEKLIQQVLIKKKIRQKGQNKFFFLQEIRQKQLQQRRFASMIQKQIQNKKIKKQNQIKRREQVEQVEQIFRHRSYRVQKSKMKQKKQ